MQAARRRPPPLSGTRLAARGCTSCTSVRLADDRSPDEDELGRRRPGDVHWPRPIRSTSGYRPDPGSKSAAQTALSAVRARSTRSDGADGVCDGSRPCRRRAHGDSLVVDALHVWKHGDEHAPKNPFACFRRAGDARPLAERAGAHRLAERAFVDCRPVRTSPALVAPPNGRVGALGTAGYLAACSARGDCLAATNSASQQLPFSACTCTVNGSDNGSGGGVNCAPLPFTAIFGFVPPRSTTRRRPSEVASGSV
jgi:hypothetical protein